LNTAIGFNALYRNTTGNSNTVTGAFALQSNTTGGGNTASRAYALSDNTTGDGNTANGAFSLFSNTTGSGNTAIGSALAFNTTGSENTAIGGAALSNNNGNDNTAIGNRAMEFHFNGDNNMAIGWEALSRAGGANNIALGSGAGNNLDTGDNNIFIGTGGRLRESNTIRIGHVGTQTATYVAGISGATVPDGVAVIVGTDGHLGTIISSARYKEAIEPMDEASEVIHALKPVTFRYKHEFDPAGIPQFGLVAEEVEKVNPDLVARDADGKPYTVRYEAVNAMLLNEFLKAHRKVEEQQATIAQLRAADAKQEAIIAKQQEQIERLTAGLQKVSAQVELSKPAPQTVLNNQ
jgi:trimeric autotransporter adhesin